MIVQAPDSILSDLPSAMLENPAGSSRIILICEHAGHMLPESIGSLGLDREMMTAHIGWDIGAAELARALSERLDATLILQRYSRLAFDCNRALHAHDAIVETSDGVAVPGNLNLTPKQRQQRYDEIYQPFHLAIQESIEDHMERGKSPVIVTIHSFTPLYKGGQRTLDLGVLHDSDTRFADRILSIADLSNDYITRRNEPYAPQDGVTHTLTIHGISRSLLNVMLEVRNDLISETKGQLFWAQRLTDILNRALDN